MIIGVKLIGEPSDKTYYFNVKENVIAEMLAITVERGFPKYYLVDTVQGEKAAELVGIGTDGKTPDGVKPTKDVIRILSDEEVADYKKFLKRKAAERRLKSKISQIYHEIGKENSKYDIPAHCKAIILNIMKPYLCSDELSKDVDDLMAFDREWRDLL